MTGPGAGALAWNNRPVFPHRILLSMKHAILSATLLCLLAPMALAQTSVRVMTNITGVVQRVGANPCDPTATHQIACSNVLLRSSVVDLTSFEGRMTVVEGDAQDNGGCVTMAVECADAATQFTTLLAPFGFRPNQTVIFTTRAPVGSFVGLFCGERGYLPLLDLGVLLLDPLAGITFLGTDISIGITLRTIRIPNDMNLVGMEPVFQTFYLQLTPLGGGLLNPTCFRIVQ